MRCSGRRASSAPSASKSCSTSPRLLSHQPVPRGPRVAILTNAGGPGILAADACEANGLELPPLSEATRAELRSFLPAAASVGNPVDMLASAPPDHYRRALAAILARRVGRQRHRHLHSAARHRARGGRRGHCREAPAASHGKPVLGVFMRAEGAPAALSPMPCYAFPESAALALARVTTLRTLARQAGRSRRRCSSDSIGTRSASSSSGASAAAADGRPRTRRRRCSRAAGIHAARLARRDDAGERARRQRRQLGYPVALKALGPTLLHKTERRAVRLNIARRGRPARGATRTSRSRFGDEMTSVLVQRMVPPGVEMIVGALQDPLFGPLIACGTGGVLVDLLADTAFRLHPLAEPTPPR